MRKSEEKSGQLKTLEAFLNDLIFSDLPIKRFTSDRQSFIKTILFGHASSMQRLPKGANRMSNLKWHALCKTLLTSSFSPPHKPARNMLSFILQDIFCATMGPELTAGQMTCTNESKGNEEKLSKNRRPPHHPAYHISLTVICVKVISRIVKHVWNRASHCNWV